MSKTDLLKSSEASGTPRAAVVELNVGPVSQFTVTPISASGTGTVTARPLSVTGESMGFETVYDSAGAALTVDLSAQATHILEGHYAAIKVQSDTGADTFRLTVGG